MLGTPYVSCCVCSWLNPPQLLLSEPTALPGLEVPNANVTDWPLTRPCVQVSDARPFVGQCPPPAIGEVPVRDIVPVKVEPPVLLTRQKSGVRVGTKRHAAVATGTRPNIRARGLTFPSANDAVSGSNREVSECGMARLLSCLEGVPGVAARCRAALQIHTHQ